MTLEDQVAPLALALRMKELGFPQETCFGWFIDVAQGVEVPASVAVRMQEPKRTASVVQATHYGGPPESFPPPAGFVSSPAWWPPRLLCAAPTVAEMGEWLLEFWYSRRGVNGWECGRSMRGELVEMGEGRTEAEARAKTLIVAVEERLLDLDDIGGRANS
jgi:hypothetical protein